MIKYLILCLVLSGCASSPQPVWIPAAWAASPFPFTYSEVDYMPAVCGMMAVGCYVVELHHAFIASRLNPRMKKCVLEHEEMHHKGLDHPKGYNGC